MYVLPCAPWATAAAAHMHNVDGRRQQFENGSFELTSFCGFSDSILDDGHPLLDGMTCFARVQTSFDIVHCQEKKDS